MENENTKGESSLLWFILPSTRLGSDSDQGGSCWPYLNMKRLLVIVFSAELNDVVATFAGYLWLRRLYGGMQNGGMFWQELSHGIDAIGGYRILTNVLLLFSSIPSSPDRLPSQCFEIVCIVATLAMTRYRSSIYPPHGSLLRHSHILFMRYTWAEINRNPFGIPPLRLLNKKRHFMLSGRLLGCKVVALRALCTWW